MSLGRAFVVDDDASLVQIHLALLRGDGWQAEGLSDSARALEAILSFRPELVLLDTMMPKLGGFELCRQIKSCPELAGTRVFICSAKPFDQDRRQAAEAGADGYLLKPLTVESLRKTLRDLDLVVAEFWGVRGTLPVPGKNALRYGGNTSCVSLELPGNRLFIFDAGTGIKCLSDKIMKDRRRVEAHIFISHPHWDHINAFPFFVPSYLQGNEITVYGPSQGITSMHRLMSDQMDGVYFPVTLKEFAARVEFIDFTEDSYEVKGVPIKTKLLCHPGNALAYRVDYAGRSFCYVTDNELYLPGAPGYDERFQGSLAEFLAGADMLIHDTTYTDEQYKSKVDWGHSSVSQVARLAHAAKVKNLYLFHHDPAQSDDDISAKLSQAEAALETLYSAVRCHLAVEQERIEL